MSVLFTVQFLAGLDLLGLGLVFCLVGVFFATSFLWFLEHSQGSCSSK